MSGPVDVTTPEWQRVIARIDGYGGGNCMQSATTLVENAVSLGLVGARIVGGQVLGRDGAMAGKMFQHYWCEASGYAYDFARTSISFTVLPVAGYRALGQVEDVEEFR